MNEKAMSKVFTIAYRILAAYAIINILLLSLDIAALTAPSTSLLKIFLGDSIIALLFLGYVLFKIMYCHIVFYAIFSFCHIVKSIREKKILFAILGLFIIILGITLNIYCIEKEPIWTAKISW